MRGEPVLFWGRTEPLGEAARERAMAAEDRNGEVVSTQGVAVVVLASAVLLAVSKGGREK
jgi:hypothetical protein